MRNVGVIRRHDLNFMLVIFPFHQGDFDLAMQLHSWISELDGPMPNHELLLIASSGITNDQIKELSAVAKKSFPRISAIRQNGVDPKKWPQGPNSMFRAAVEWVKTQNKGPWFFMETDHVPIVKGWLDKLEQDYRMKGKPFYGSVFDKPFRHLNGSMILPQSIGKFNPAMMGANELPFDLIRADITLKYGHATNLIQRSLADSNRNLCHTFPDRDSLRIINPQAVTFHGSKDSSLIQRLRERRNGIVLPAKPKHSNGFVPKLKRTLKGLVTTKTTNKTAYYHTGNLGDIVYAMAAIRLHGGGDLVIGPRHPQTDPCSMPVNQEQFNRLAPLLNEQPYIRTARWVSAYPTKSSYPTIQIENDLNTFRNYWFNLDIRIESGANSLCAMHCYTLGVLDRFNEKEAWLTVPKQKNDRIIIARSLRHRNWDMPYDQVIKEFGERCLFVGTTQEHMIFELCWPKVEFKPVNDFLEMATLIAGSKGCVMNQSFPCALALGLGMPVCQEVFAPAPDCQFKRRNFFNQEQMGDFIKAVK